MKTTQFRIWDLKKQRWFKGGVWKMNGMDCIDLFGETILFGEIMRDDNTDEVADLDYLKNLVVLQNTGIKDNHGDYVFEGDIVRLYNGQWSEWIEGDVFWDDHNAMFCISTPTDTYTFGSAGNQMDTLEIVNNKYERKIAK
jgi:uncharacterized phage protein (TIGR01671 family)